MRRTEESSPDSMGLPDRTTDRTTDRTSPSTPDPVDARLGARPAELRTEVTERDTAHRLGAGDCLRMRVWGPTRFRCADDMGVCYLLAVVRP